MRLRRPGAGTRVVLLAVSVLLLLSAFAVPALAAGQRTQFIHSVEWFEDASASCANGTFEASGAFTATGNSRSCARDFRAPGIVQGTTQLHNTDDLSIRWKVQCKENPGDRPLHFDCRGQWIVDGPNWQGSGNARAVLRFDRGPFGQIEWTFNGNLSPA